MGTKENVMDPGLAKGWKHEPLSELITFATGGVWGDAPDTANGVNSLEAACIRGTDFRDWEVRKASAAVSRAIDAKSLEKRKLQSGDILVEVSGGGPEQPVGRTVHIDEEAIESAQGRPMVPTNFLRLLRLRSGVDAAYVNYYLKYFYVTGNISDYQGGSNNLRNLRFKDYITIDIPLAPLPEQRRIVEAIELQLGRLDAAVARLQGAKARLKRYKQAVLKAAVEGIEVDGVEEDLGSISELITSGSRGWAAYYAAAGDTFIRAQNLKYDRLDLSDIAYVKLPAKVDGLRTQVQKNDILITITGANVTKTALVTEVPEGRAFVNQHIALVRLKNPAQAPFVYRWIISPAHGRGILEKLAYGAGKPGLNLSNIRDLLIPIPPQEDQVQTVAKLEAIDCVNDEMETTLDAQLAQAVRLRQSVLKRAFEGRLV